jgi:hypothetical protein
VKKLFLFKHLSVLCTVVVLSAVLSSGTAFAQNTASSIRVVVSDSSGNAAGGVTVSIVHVPTGRAQVSTSSSDGVVIARGLAVGGPYEISVVGGSQYAADVLQNVYTELDKTVVVDLGVRPVIEEIVVSAQAPTAEVAVGVGRAFNRSTIDGTPSLSRDFISALATDPKILVDNSVARGPAVSLAGGNFRFNSVTIDGVAQNDNFGLSKNASATQRTPISIDAIEAVTVNIAPFDVSYGNFIGGNINIVTKSGTNDFEGSVYAFSTDDNMTGDKSDGADLKIGDFSEDYVGFTLGGPIVKDKAFFFVNYEKFETDRQSNSQNLDNIAGVTQQDIDDAIEIFQDVYGFDAGTFDATDTDEDEKILIKLDWYVNDDHRVSATYQEAEGDVIFDDFPESASLQSNRYNINEKLEAYSLQLFSNWSDNFSTELKIGSKDLENRQISGIDPGQTAAFELVLPTGGVIKAGNDVFRHANELDNESDLFRLRADWQLGDHLLTGGYEREKYTVRNLFTPGSRGWWTFSGLDDLRNGVVTSVLYGNSNAPDGDPSFAETEFSLAVDSFYIQDEWTPTDDLTLKFGLRLDEYSNNDEIPLNDVIEERYGFTNQENLDGKDLVSPRFGFTWDASDRLTVRGGAGLFGGGAPLIILSNSYAGNGITRTFLKFMAIFNTSPEQWASVQQGGQDLPTNPTGAAFDNLHQYIGPNDPAQDNLNIDLIDPSFDILSAWKYNIGAEYVLGDDWILSGDVILTNADNGYDIYEARRTVVGQAPDGRPIYTTDFDGGDYIVTNTSKGDGTVVTFGLEKSFDTNVGLFDVNLGYAWQDVQDPRSYNRFVAYESYAFDPQFDKENPDNAPSKFEVEDRITANMIWRNEWFGDNTTTIGLSFSARSGRHFSYVFGSAGSQTFGGSTGAEFFFESDNIGSQLFYVPTGTNDPIITGDPDFLDDLDTFISGDSCLKGKRGTVVGRNACSTDWVNIFSLRLQQEIKVGESAFDLFLDIENFGNLINDDWGRIDSYTAPGNVAPAAAVGIDNSGATPAYVLVPGASYQGTPDTIVSKPAIARFASAYRIQLGVKFRF